MKKTIRSPRNRFSLIELLVVISIIAILASLLLPALNKAKSQVKTLDCLNRVKQVNSAATMYTNDNDGYYPQLVQTIAGSGIFWTQRLCLDGYFGSITLTGSDLPYDLFSCPIRNSPPVRDRPSWGLNLNISTWGGSFTTKQIHSLKNPSKTFLLIESLYNVTPDEDYGFFMMCGANYPGGATNQEYYMGHGGKRLTTAFPDGHAETKQRSDMENYRTTSTKPPWGL